jgi:hypothetical protein
MSVNRIEATLTDEQRNLANYTQAAMPLGGREGLEVGWRKPDGRNSI